jgi:CrcB protein
LFPFGTITVNVIGSLILGLLAGITLNHTEWTTTQVIIGTGFCGGLTTWSTASWETVRLIEEGANGTALRHTVVNLTASLGAAGLGLLLVLH